jgi:hypothetical protein
MNCILCLLNHVFLRVNYKHSQALDQFNTTTENLYRNKNVKAS